MSKDQNPELQDGTVLRFKILPFAACKTYAAREKPSQLITQRLNFIWLQQINLLGIKGDTQSKIPFREGRSNRRSTILKLLEANSFRSEDFQCYGEQDWMVRANLLIRSRRAFHQKRLVNIGQLLYKSLFPPETVVKRALVQSLAKAEEKSTQLHIQLQFAADDMQQIRLPDYPWELMHDGRGFLAHYQVTFSRYIAYDAVPIYRSSVEQVNVLLASSTAFDKENGFLQFSNQEQRAIRKALRKAEQEGHIHLDQLKCATVNELRTYLNQQRENKVPHVFHFDGHGFFGQRCNNDQCRKIHKGKRADSCNSCGNSLSESQGYLLFEDEEGGANYVSAQELGVLLHQASFSDQVSQKRGVTLVVLSACQSALSLFGKSVFNGVAQSLISHRIPAVIAMQYKVKVSSAAAFTEQFYCSLGQRDSLALAMSQAREAMGVEGNQWYRPVLYLRWKDNEGGQLFAESQALASQNIEQVSQAVSNQLASASSVHPYTEISRAVKTASGRNYRRTYYRNHAERWLGDKESRLNLALIIATRTLESQCFNIEQVNILQEDNEAFIRNLYNCLNWLADALQHGKGKSTDRLKENLVEHLIETYITALNILKDKVEEDLKGSPDVIETLHRYINNLIAIISL